MVLNELEAHPRVFVTGAFIQPMKISHQGADAWVWVVTSFVDDSFSEDGEVCIPNECAYSQSKLITEIEND